MPDKSVIRVGCLRIADHFIAGVTKGRSEKKDVGFSSFEMQLDILNTTDQLADSLLEGKIDGAFLPLPFAMELFRTGSEIRFLLFTNRGGGIFVKNSAAEIKRIVDFKDKIILTPCLLSVQNMFLHKIFLSAGLTLGLAKDKNADVFMEVVPSNIVAEIIKNDSDNEIGGFVAPEPFGTLAINQGNCKEVCKFDSLWPDYPNSVFVLKEPVIKKNPEYVVELVNAFIEAGRIIDLGNDDNLISYAEKFFKQENEIVQSLLLKTKGMYAPKKLIPDCSIADIVQDYMVDNTDLMHTKIDIEQFVDTNFT
ncbi:MAG: ABC transporter substrate-binding protein [Desulfobacteraceae bacterium]|nr:ABC transporter substrate-binding protein [Desulfobacteraceae bacterium]